MRLDRSRDKGWPRPSRSAPRYMPDAHDLDRVADHLVGEDVGKPLDDQLSMASSAAPSSQRQFRQALRGREQRASDAGSGAGISCREIGPNGFKIEPRSVRPGYLHFG